MITTDFDQSKTKDLFKNTRVRKTKEKKNRPDKRKPYRNPDRSWR